MHLTFPKPPLIPHINPLNHIVEVEELDSPVITTSSYGNSSDKEAKTAEISRAGEEAPQSGCGTSNSKPSNFSDIQEGHGDFLSAILPSNSEVQKIKNEIAKYIINPKNVKLIQSWFRRRGGRSKQKGGGKTTKQNSKSKNKSKSNKASKSKKKNKTNSKVKKNKTNTKTKSKTVKGKGTKKSAKK
jgi:hypothetical protein